jgi:hypothetical protein
MSEPEALISQWVNFPFTSHFQRFSEKYPLYNRKTDLEIVK